MKRVSLLGLSVLLAACAEPTAPVVDVRGPALAVTVDPATGVGFVGKGDVQLTYGWNNKQLQDNAGKLAFSVQSEVVTEVSWVCTNTRNENTQERERTTTTTTEGLVYSVARDKKSQITGFNLTGFSGTSSVVSDTEGPHLNSCPTNWVLTTPAGDPVVISSTGAGVFVSWNGATPVPVQSPAP